MLKTKKNLFISILAVLMTVCAFFGVLSASNFKTVNATSPTFVMGDKASIRLGQDDMNGMRFYVTFDGTIKEKANSGYGFLVFPHALLGSVTDDYHNKITKYVEIKGSVVDGVAQKIYTVDEENGIYGAQAAYLKILPQNFGLEFTCVAYVGNETDGYTYATVDRNFSRSMYDVANVAYFDNANVSNGGLMEVYGLESEYGFGSETYPVLITDASQLSVISDVVANGSEDYLDSTFENINFKLANDITIDDDNYTVIPAAFAGKIDTNGVNVNCNYFRAFIVEDETNDLTGAAYVSKGKAPADFVTVSSTGWSGKAGYTIDNKIYSGAIYVGDYNNYFVDGSTLDFAGDYSGNASRATPKNQNGWWANYDFAPEQLPYVENYYSHVKFYMAVSLRESDATADGVDVSNWYITVGKTKNTIVGLLPSAEEVDVNSIYTFNADNDNTWVEFTIPVSVLAANSATVADVGQNRISLGSVVSTSVAWAKYVDYYIGDLTFINKSIDSIYTITANNYDKITNSSVGNPTFVANADLPDTISGYYAGNAVSFTQTKDGTQGTFNLKVPGIANVQKEDLLLKYTHVKLNMALVASAGSNLYSNGLIATLAGASGSITFNTWNTYTIKMSDFIEYVGDNGSISLLSSYCTSTEERTWYFGDVELVGVLDYVMKVGKNESIIAKAYNAQSSKLVTNAEIVADGITGDYTGNAIKFYYSEDEGGAYSGTNTMHYYITLPVYNDAQKEYLRDNYESVTFNIAKVGAAGFYGLYNNTTSGQNTKFSSGVWYKTTLTIDEYLAYLDANLTVNQNDPTIGSVRLLYLYLETKADSLNVVTYFGDIEFVAKSAS